MFLIRNLYHGRYMWFFNGDVYTKFGITTNDNKSIMIHSTYYMPTTERNYV